MFLVQVAEECLQPHQVGRAVHGILIGGQQGSVPFRRAAVGCRGAPAAAPGVWGGAWRCDWGAAGFRRSEESSGIVQRGACSRSMQRLTASAGRDWLPTAQLGISCQLGHIQVGYAE